MGSTLYQSFLGFMSILDCLVFWRQVWYPVQLGCYFDEPQPCFDHCKRCGKYEKTDAFTWLCPNQGTGKEPSKWMVSQSRAGVPPAKKWNPHLVFSVFLGTFSKRFAHLRAGFCPSTCPILGYLGHLGEREAIGMS